MNAFPLDELLDDSLLTACGGDPTLETYLLYEDYKIGTGEELPITVFVRVPAVNWDDFSECHYQYNQIRRRYKAELRQFVPRKKAGGKKILALQKPCEFCGEMFKPKLARDRFCSHGCSAKRFERAPNICVVCGSRFKKESTRAFHKFCSEACRAKSRTNVVIEFHGETRSLKEWAEVTGISEEHLRKRRSAKWSAEKMLTIPVKRYKARSA